MSLSTRLRGSEVELLTVDGRIRGTIAGATMISGGDTFSDLRAVELVDVWDSSAGIHMHGMQRFEASEIIKFENIKWRPLEKDELEENVATTKNPSLDQQVCLLRTN